MEMGVTPEWAYRVLYLPIYQFSEFLRARPLGGFDT
jgi:hypothetical protein